MNELSDIFTELIERTESKIRDVELEKSDIYIENLEREISAKNKIISIKKRELKLYDALIIEFENLLENNENNDEYITYLKEAKEAVREIKKDIIKYQRTITSNQNFIKKSS